MIFPELGGKIATNGLQRRFAFFGLENFGYKIEVFAQIFFAPNGADKLLDARGDVIVKPLFIH